MLDSGEEAAGDIFRRQTRWQPRSPRQSWLVVAAVAVIMGVAYLIVLALGGHPRLVFFAAVPSAGAVRLWLNALSRPSRLKQRRILGESAAALLAAGVPGEVAQLVRDGKKIQAIKQYRKLIPGLGLKEAKDIIDSDGR